MDIRHQLFQLYWRFEQRLAPGLKYAQVFYEDTLFSHGNKNRWLDIGCGHRLLPSWRFDQERDLVRSCATIIGLDYDFHSLKKHKSIQLRVRGNVLELPFKSRSLDLVSANMVVEHLENPDVQFREINRVLKPGGLFVFHTPNNLGYTTLLARAIPEAFKTHLISYLQGRKEEDVFPTYYRANSAKRIEALAAASGFRVERIHLLASSAQLVMLFPLVLLELMWIRFLLTDSGKKLRTNIISVLRKDNDPSR